MATHPPAQKGKIAFPRRGEVYLASFDPTAGVLQNNVSNRYSPITIVAAITSQVNEELYPTEVLIGPPEGI